MRKAQLKQQIREICGALLDPPPRWPYEARPTDEGWRMNVRLVADKTASVDALQRYPSITALIEEKRPVLPYYALHPERFKLAAKRFLDEFPGTTMYAVKANPAIPVLDQIYASGVRHFDTASLAEIELIRGRYADAICHFMAPVRLPCHAAAAWNQYGIQDFVVDSEQELDKLLSETEGGKGLRIFVRIATPLGGAILELSSKFGTKPEHGAKLLKRIADLRRDAGSHFSRRLAMPQPIYLCPSSRDVAPCGDRCGCAHCCARCRGRISAHLSRQ